MNIDVAATRRLGQLSVCAVLAACTPVSLPPPQIVPSGGNGGGNTLPNREVGASKIANAAERSRMERYVNDLQAAKKVARSFQIPGGEMIDCVDVFSQPALRRRGMENHKVELAPRTQPTAGPTPANVTGTRAQVNQLYSISGETCPVGTAPMTRITMETLQRFRTLDDFFRKGGDPDRSGPVAPEDSAHEYAKADLAVDNRGAESVFNLWSPYVETSGEFSLAQFWVVRGTGADKETVEAGWQVYKDLYGDWRAHLFIYFTPDNYGSGGCYNLSCSGFVQTNNTVYIGGAFTDYSSSGGAQYEMKLLMYKDGADGAWWLKYGDTWVGYYPRSLFDANGLESNAGWVKFGGEIVNNKTGGRHTETDMGSGHWPYEGFGQTAFQLGLRYVDTNNVYRQATGMTVFKTNRECYDIDVASSTGAWETYLFFGGSGHNTKCP